MLLEGQFRKLKNGKTIHYASLGQGPPLFFLHGYPDQLQVWYQLAPLLAQNFQCIALDWPGMGKSDAWQGGATPFHMAKNLEQIIDDWGFSQVSLLAHDMGAQPAAIFASQNPQRMERLFLMNFLAFHNLETSWEIEILRNFGWNRFIIEKLPIGVYWRALNTFVPSQFPIEKEIKENIWEDFKKKPARKFISKMCAGYQATLNKLPGYYAKIQCPTHVLWGEKDKHFPVIQGEKLKSVIPKCRYNIIDGGEHWMVIHKAKEVYQFILEGLK